MTQGSGWWAWLARGAWLAGAWLARGLAGPGGLAAGPLAVAEGEGRRGRVVALAAAEQAAQ